MISPTISMESFMEPIQEGWARRAEGGTNAATGFPKRVARRGVRVRRTVSSKPRHLALNSEMETSFIRSRIVTILYHGQNNSQSIFRNKLHAQPLQMLRFSGRTAPALSRPSHLKAIHGLTGCRKLLGGARSFRAGFFLQFQHHRQTSLRRRPEGFDGGGPVDGAVVGREVFVLFAVIVVEVDGRNKIAQRGDSFFCGLVLREVGV